MIFYTADLHFLYEPLLSSRPFATVEEMDETLIRNWNETVSPEDTVYLVGDIGYNEGQVPHALLSRLTGHKHLIPPPPRTPRGDKGWLPATPDFRPIPERPNGQ